MARGVSAQTLNDSIAKIFAMPEEYQSVIVTLIDNMSNLTKPKSERRNIVGIANGTRTVPDDIDYCNEEIAALFGIR
jgi:hypothetical protein